LWVYYGYELGVEFVDETGTGQYRIRRYDGDLFGAMDAMMLGQYARGGSVFKKTFVDFNLRYDPSGKEFIITLPVDSLNISDDQGVPRIDLDFIIFVYPQETGGKEKIWESRLRQPTDKEFIDMKERRFHFPPSSLERRVFRRRQHQRKAKRRGRSEDLRSQGLEKAVT
jgi:hypothetical protein